MVVDTEADVTPDPWLSIQVHGGYSVFLPEATALPKHDLDSLAQA